MSIVNGDGSFQSGTLHTRVNLDEAVAASVQPAPVVAPPSSADVTLPPAVTAGLLAWLVFGIGAAAVAGFFRKRSILGPQRLGAGQSAVSLLFDFFAGLAAMIIVLSLASLAHPKGLTAVLVASSIAELAGWGVIVLLLWRNGSITRLGLALRKVPRGMLVGLMAMFILFPIVAATAQGTGAVLHWMGKPPPAPHEVLESLGDTHDPRVVAVDVIAAVVVAPLAEELVFRGVLQTLLGRLLGRLIGRRRGGDYDSATARWLAVLIAAACFAAVHDVAAFFPALFVLAIGLGYVYERTGNLWCTVTMHALFNGCEIALFLSPLGR